MKRVRKLRQTCYLLSLSLASNAFVWIPTQNRRQHHHQSLSILHQAKDSKKLREEAEKSENKSIFSRIFSSSEEKPPEPEQVEEDNGIFGVFQRQRPTEEKKDDKARSKSEKKSKEKQLRKETRPEKKPKEKSKKQEAQQADSNLSESSDGWFSKTQEYVGGVVGGLFSGSDSKGAQEQEDSDSSKGFSFNPLPGIQRYVSSAFSSNTSAEEEWVPVFPITRLSPGEIVPATIGGIDLLVIASKDGRKLYCIANSCSHLGTPLETGKLVRLPNESNYAEKERGRREPQSTFITETEVSQILQQDGLEDCIVCPLHRTAFALQSGEVRGEWCPYPPVIGALVGTIKQPTGIAVFDVRTRGKQIEVRINTPLVEEKPSRRS